MSHTHTHTIDVIVDVRMTSHDVIVDVRMTSHDVIVGIGMTSLPVYGQTVCDTRLVLGCAREQWRWFLENVGKLKVEELEEFFISLKNCKTQ